MLTHLMVSTDGIIQRYSTARLRAAVAGIRPDYVKDWQRWLDTLPEERPATFVRILGSWQATRPKPMRRLRSRAHEHSKPHIEDLLATAEGPLQAFSRFRLGREGLSLAQRAALRELWSIFRRLRQDDTASCVAISKAVMLLTDGRVGPALDSRVRSELGIRKVENPDAWAAALDFASRDVAAFEARHGRLQQVVQRKFSHLETGRLYDMALGPRRNLSSPNPG